MSGVQGLDNSSGRASGELAATIARHDRHAYAQGVRTISLVDHTERHVPPAKVLTAIAEALTIQVERDFVPAWGVNAARFTVGGRGDKLHFFDSAHQAGDYGWHIVDGHGLPYAHVFADPSISAGSDWITGPDAISVTASHEALEMLADPAANEYSFNGARLMWAREVCDAVQANTYRIDASGFRVPVSNFVLPAFFNPWADGPYDHLGVLRDPFSLAAGGYAILERATPTRERDAHRFDVTFDDAVPAWQRRQKREGWGRTYWRLALNP
jgi:hypothetical protein